MTIKSYVTKLNSKEYIRLYERSGKIFASSLIPADADEKELENKTLTFKEIYVPKQNSMNLLQAKKEAAAKSAKTKKSVYITLMKGGNGECAITDTFSNEVMFKFENGLETPVKEDDPKINAVTTNTEKPKLVILDKPKEKVKPTKNKLNRKKMASTASKKPVPAKRSTEVKIPRGNNMFLSASEWKKVDVILAKEKISFSAWSRNLVLAKIK